MFGHPSIHSSLVKFAKISAASSGDNTLVAAVTGKKIRVLAALINMVGTAVAIKFQSDSSGTDLTGALAVAQNGSISFPFSPVGHFESAKSKLLNLNLGGAQTVAGYLAYQEVDG